MADQPARDGGDAPLAKVLRFGHRADAAHQRSSSRRIVIIIIIIAGVDRVHPGAEPSDQIEREPQKLGRLR